MTEEVVWRLLYNAAGVKVEELSHAQLDEVSSLCGLNTGDGGYWRGLWQDEYAPHHPACSVLLEEAALAAALLLAVEE